jgi:glycosyltransferase involved in cell wall biosynthesis
MKLDSPDISVVTPAYRAEAFIGRAIQSVLDQPGVNPEIIVVVDGVFDRTPEIAAKYSKTKVLVNETNQGAPAARNRGLAVATAPFVQFLDADDFVEGPLLSGLLAASTQDELDIAFGPCFSQLIDGQRKELNGPTSADPMGFIREWLCCRFLPPCCVLWRTSFVRRIGGWKEGLLRNQDGELVWRCLLAGAKPGYSHEGAGIYVEHHGQARITARWDAQAWQSRLQILDWLFSELKSSGRLDEPMRRVLVNHLYGQMRESFLWGQEDVAIEFEDRWRRFGGRRHQGTWLHRFASTLIGLRRKQKLSKQMASLKPVVRKISRRLATRGPALLFKRI